MPVVWSQFGANVSVTATPVRATSPELVTTISKLAALPVLIEVGFAVFAMVIAGWTTTTALVSKLVTADKIALPLLSTG